MPNQHGSCGKLIVDSTADKETTRRSISRIEQIFAAYREILPPRRTRPAAPLRIKLFGAMQQYQAYLADLGPHVENPAVFVPSRNLLVAGSELSAYAEQLQGVRQRHRALRRNTTPWRRKCRLISCSFAKIWPPADSAKEDQNRFTRATEARWKKQESELDRQIHAADRKNVAEFDRVTERMFVRLYHEAFHAYLENYVYPQSDHDVPRWLNEGLAQVFEGGQLESGSLRLDAPDAARLKLLQQDLRSPQVLSLSELLTADASRFLVFHPGGARASERYYLYSWGLAYYLAFRQPIWKLRSWTVMWSKAPPRSRRSEHSKNSWECPWLNSRPTGTTEMLKMRSNGR